MNIILRSSWQTVNIGDIAHSPAIIGILKENINDCNITLWATSNINQDVKNLIHFAYPDVKIITGTLKDEKNTELINAVDNSDMLIHGSGARFVAYSDVYDYYERTKKPFGIFGITFDLMNTNECDIEKEKQLLNKAKFIYYRDKKSLKLAKKMGIRANTMDFGCDGVFGYNIINKEKASETMAKYNLTKDKFVCVIPRLRYTPYWEINKNKPLDKEKNEYNLKMAEPDNLPLREAIIKIIKETEDIKIFICPEDATQVKLGKEILYDKLPEIVKNRVALKKEYWLCDEALGVYKNSLGLFGCEMHSPIMCIGNGIPAIVARFKEQTTKGYMWEDIGLGEWLFDFDDENEKKNFADVCLSMVINHEKSIEYARNGRKKAFATYKKIIESIIF